MAQELVTIGFILLFVAIALILVGAFTGGKADVKYGVGGFIGPIPFGFGNDPRMVWIVIALSAILLAIFLFGRNLF